MKKSEKVIPIERDPIEIEFLKVGGRIVELTERGLTIVCTDKAEKEFIFIPATRTWFRSNDSFMEKDDRNKIRHLIDDQIRNLDKALFSDLTINSLHRKQIRKMINRLDRAQVMREVKQRLEGNPALVRCEADFNVKDHLLNASNGVIDLLQGKLLPARPLEWLMGTKIGFVNNKSEPELFQRFLDDFCCGRTNLKKYLLRYLGYALTGEITDQSLMILLGSGSNGKSVLFEVLAGILGDFFGKVDRSILISSRDTSSHAMAELDGLRVALVSETAKTDVWDDGRLKQLVGEKTFVARKLYQSVREFRNTATIFVYCNSIARSNANDLGFMRRLRIFPCEFKVQPEKRDPNLAKRILESEKESILALLVNEARLWYSEGMLPEPDEMTLAKSVFKDENDCLSEFIDQFCVRSGSVQGADLFGAYQKWARNNNLPIFKRTTFYKEINERGIQRVNDVHKETVSFLGISLK